MDFDFNLGFLDEVLGLIDRRLDALEAECAASPDPDSFGLFDSIEHVVGFGFAACQHYVVATAGSSGISKHKVLGLGPSHRSGITFAEIVNAAANYWKHSPEWVGRPQEDDTKNVVLALGISPDSDYVSAQVLRTALAPHPARFEKIEPFLEEWGRIVRRGGGT